MSSGCPMKIVDDKPENEAFLSEQIITYIGNKRALLSFIGTALDEVKKELGKDKLDVVDIFSGSGIVSRYFKKYSAHLYVNDLEDYCCTINRCYLSNKEDIDLKALESYYLSIREKLDNEPLKAGFIRTRRPVSASMAGTGAMLLRGYWQTLSLRCRCSAISVVRRLSCRRMQTGWRRSCPRSISSIWIRLITSIRTDRITSC